MRERTGAEAGRVPQKKAGAAGASDYHTTPDSIHSTSALPYNDGSGRSYVLSKSSVGPSAGEPAR
jgi:hypothetical protein